MGHEGRYNIYDEKWQFYLRSSGSTRHTREPEPEGSELEEVGRGSFPEPMFDARRPILGGVPASFPFFNPGSDWLLPIAGGVPASIRFDRGSAVRVHSGALRLWMSGKNVWFTDDTTASQGWNVLGTIFLTPAWLLPYIARMPPGPAFLPKVFTGDWTALQNQELLAKLEVNVGWFLELTQQVPTDDLLRAARADARFAMPFTKDTPFAARLFQVEVRALQYVDDLRFCDVVRSRLRDLIAAIAGVDDAMQKKEGGLAGHVENGHRDGRGGSSGAPSCGSRRQACG